MTTTVEIPDDLARAVQRRAAEQGRDVAAEVVELVRRGLAVSEKTVQPAALVPPVIGTDPHTGLPVIISPPDAPIHSMSAAEVLALEQSILEEEDLKRAGLSL
jgi:plasmid stability protein